MELKTHICRQLLEKGRAFTQITLDDDFIVRDHKPDVIRTIYTKGEIRTEDTKVGSQVVWVSGKLHFSTLYQSDQEEQKLALLEGDLPFQEKVMMEEVEESDEVILEATLEDLSIGIINSRKLVVRAVVSLLVICQREQEQVITTGITEDTQCRIKAKEIEMLCLSETKQDVVRMGKELLLPNARSNFGEIIFYQVDYRNQEITLKEDYIGIAMDAQLWVIYRSESTGEYECFETLAPLTGRIDLPQVEQNDICWVRIHSKESQLEPREDYDGEARMLGLETSFGVEVQLFREESCQMLLDAYALNQDLVMEKQVISNPVFLIKNISKIRIFEQEKIDPKQERILQICGSDGRIVLDRVQKKENGVVVEGILSVSVLYNTNEDAVPYQSHNSQLSFEQFVEIPDCNEKEVKLRLEANLEQLQVNLLDNAEYEIKATIQIGLFASCEEKMETIVSMEEKPLNMEELQRQPGIIGVCRKEGEEIWDIAKKYHAAPENIIELREKVLVVKQVR